MDHKKSDEPFLQRQLKKIVINTEQLQTSISVQKGIYTQTHLWSLLKLVFLSYSSYIYSRIMSKHHYFSDKYYYVDLFAGSGIGQVVDSDKKELVFGSPLLIATTRKFSKMFFCESKETSRIALKERLKAIGINENSYEIYGDCNVELNKIIDQVKDGHSLIFVDPWSMEIEWGTMERLLSLNADIIFNLQSAEIARGVIQQGKLTNSARKFFKNPKNIYHIFNNQSNSNKPELILNNYARDIINTRKEIDSNKKIVRETKVYKIKIKGVNSFFYDLLFITRLTSNKSPWLMGLAVAAKNIDNIKPKTVDLALEILSGKQQTLNSNLISG